MNKLFDKIEITKSPRPGAALHMPSSELDFRNFEEAHSMILPDDYKAFAAKFGAGILAENYIIYVPGCNRSPDLDLAYWNKACHKFDEELALRFPGNKQIPRLIHFCSTYMGDLIGWDPLDVRDAKKHDYAIYGLPRNDDLLVEVAPSFREFVKRAFTPLAGILKFKSTSYSPPRTFQYFTED